MAFEETQANPSKDYMLRTTQQHHVQLSVMADAKANIMIAATSILLTFAFANFKQQNLFWGFLALFVFSFFSLILAILAVSPTIGREKHHRRNLLFFGHFTDMTQDAYVEAMEGVLETDSTTYEAIVRDIHDIGMNIATKKYKYLSRSYQTFLAGIVIAGVLFVTQTLLFTFT